MSRSHSDGVGQRDSIVGSMSRGRGVDLERWHNSRTCKDDARSGASGDCMAEAVGESVATGRHLRVSH